MTFLIGVVVGVASALVAALLFFLRDQIWSVPDINGIWTLRTVTKGTSYNPYKGLMLEYLVAVWLEGPVVKGTAEKVFERTHDGTEHTYEAEKRVRVSVDGYLTRRYFRQHDLVLHFTEEGRLRESTSIHQLQLSRSSPPQGTFFSTAANSTGTSALTRGTGRWVFSH